MLHRFCSLAVLPRRAGTAVASIGLSLGLGLGLGLGIESTIVANGAEADFQEVYQLLKQNLPGRSEAELNSIAIRGLLSQLPGQVVLVGADETGGTNDAAKTAASPIAKVASFDGDLGYVRVTEVGASLPAALAEALAGLSKTNQLKGLILDLRNAKGADYAASVSVADRFLSDERPLLQWKDRIDKSSAKTNAFTAPVAMLVNARTAAAAEALAAVLRKSGSGLLIGGKTAGQANFYKDFALKTGQHVRIATESLKLGDGEHLAIGGLQPDIQVEVSAEDESSYLKDPFKSPGRAGTSGKTDAASNQATNPAPRINEAELVRMRREGIDPEVPGSEELRARKLPTPAPPAPVVADPVLARGLDLLKALALLKQAKTS